MPECIWDNLLFITTYFWSSNFLCVSPIEKKTLDHDFSYYIFIKINIMTTISLSVFYLTVVSWWKIIYVLKFILKTLRIWSMTHLTCSWWILDNPCREDVREVLVTISILGAVKPVLCDSSRGGGNGSLNTCGFWIHFSLPWYCYTEMWKIQSIQNILIKTWSLRQVWL